MSTNHSATKTKRIKHFGRDNITLEQYGENFNQCLEYAKEYSHKNNGIFIHPFDDMDIIEGQGTIGLEIWNQNNNIDIIIGCLGGGGLMSGISSFYHGKKTYIYGVEPKGQIL